MDKQVCLNRGEEQDIENGSLWIYDNEIDWCTDTCRDGDVVTVLDSRRRFCAKGFFNSKSKIVVRVLTRDRKSIGNSSGSASPGPGNIGSPLGSATPAGWCSGTPTDCRG